MPEQIQDKADSKKDLLKANPNHPSLDFKPVGKSAAGPIYRAKVTKKRYRTLAVRIDPGIYVWFWIGSHDEYERIIN